MCFKGCVILLTLSELLLVCPTGKSSSLYRAQPSSCLLGPVMCKNVQKSYYGSCKTNESEFGRQFQKFYYEKTLVGNRERSRRRRCKTVFKAPTIFDEGGAGGGGRPSQKRDILAFCSFGQYSSKKKKNQKKEFAQCCYSTLFPSSILRSIISLPA